MKVEFGVFRLVKWKRTTKVVEPNMFT